MLARLRQANVKVEPSQATFFLYPRTPAPDDFDFARCLAERGLLVLPAPLFHDTGHFRLSLTTSDQQVDRAADILEDVCSGRASRARH